MKYISRIMCMILAAALVISTAGINSAAALNMAPKKEAQKQSGSDNNIDLAAKAKAEAAYAGLPLSFEVNKGQTDKSVKFLARGKGYTLFLTASEAVMTLQKSPAAKAKGQDVVRMKLKGANAAPVVKGLDMMASKSNYINGNKSAKWVTDVEHFAKVEYKQVYPGIDMVYYGNQGNLEYDFVVAPGANPALIRMNFAGAKTLQLDERGNLVLNLNNGRMAFNAPVLYQKTGGVKQPVDGRFVIASNKQVSFEVGNYDKSKELVIDPTLLYSTYLGGTVEDRVNAIALDTYGNIYMTGLTVSAGFPTPDSTAGHFQATTGGGTDAFVIKLSTAGDAQWSTFIGGAAIDIANGIAVDSSGISHITGATTSADFPTVSPYQAANAGGTDAFVTAVSSTGHTLIYSTYLGAAGVDEGNGIACDAAGNVYVTGQASASFPKTPGSYTAVGGMTDAFISKFSAAGAISYSTILGGTGLDLGRGIAIDNIGNAYVCGQAADAFFPTASYPTVFKNTISGSFDAFMAKLDSTGATLLYVTYVGGSGIDDAYSIALDGVNPVTLNAYITGFTFSADMPNPGSGFANVGQTTIGTAPDSYVFKLNMNGGGGILDGVYFTYLGGSTDDRGTCIKVDAAGNAYVTGHTTSGDFPTVNPILGTAVGTGMVFVTEIPPTGVNPRVFSTYLGGVTDQQGNGISIDAAGNIYVAGFTSSGDYPTTSTTTVPAMPAIIQAAYGGGLYDGFFSKITAPSPGAAVPDITAVLPAGGIPAGGTTVVITGTDFTGATSVKFGGVNATSYVVDYSTQITAVAPAHASGIVHIVVVTPAGSSVIGTADQYTYFIAGGIAPTITNLNPDLGPSTGGTTVIITGTGFTTVTGANGVKFGELNASSYTVISDTKITAKTKAHAVGIVDVIVTSLSGSSAAVLAGRFTYFLTESGPFKPYVFPSPTVGNSAGIAYYMLVSGTVKIRIYNEIGDLVDTIVDSKSSGAQASRVTVGSMAPGVYYYLITMEYDDGTAEKYSTRKFAVTH